MATATPFAPPALLIAGRFAALPDDGRVTELVKGVVIALPRPNFRHGKTCNNVAWQLGNHVVPRDHGHIISNDAGVITERDPDSVRGPDVAYLSYDTLARDAAPDPYPEVAPDLVFEVRSPGDRPGR